MAESEGFADYMHLVLGVVAELMRRVPKSVQREDLVAAGAVGLLQALRSNKHSCPEMFEAYARIRIRGAIIDELRRHDWSPRRRRTANVPKAVIVNGPDPAPAPSPEPIVVIVVGLDDLPADSGLCEQGPSPLEEVERRRSHVQLRSAIEMLAPRERTIIRMRFFDDVSSKAIASTLGLSEARVSQLLTRATSRLRDLLRKAPGELDIAA
jgi:RNA polymerase sigma factor FliA